LAEKISENEILTKRVFELSNLCGKNKNKWRNHKILFHYFHQLALYRKQKLLKKKVDFLHPKKLYSNIFSLKISQKTIIIKGF